MNDFKEQVKDTKDKADALTFTVDKLYQKLGDLNRQQTNLAEGGKANTKYYETITMLIDKYTVKVDTVAERLTVVNVKLGDQERVLIASRERITTWGKAWDGAKSKVDDIADKTDKFGKILGGAAAGFKPLAENLQTAVKVISPFKDAISKANAAYTDYQQNVASGKGKFESFKGAISMLTKGVEEGSGGFKTFKIALAETGIGLIIIAVAALMEKLQSIKPVMDVINAVTASIGAVMSTLGNSIVGLFTNPIDTINNFGSSMSSAAKDAFELSLAQEKLKTALSSQEVANEKIKNQVDLLQQQAENTKLSTDMRRTKLQEAHMLDEKYFKQNGDLANQSMNNAIKAAKIKGTLHDEEVANLQSKGTEYARVLLETGRIDQEQFENIKMAELDLIKMRKEHADNFQTFLDNRQKLTDEDQAKADEKKAAQLQKAKELADKRRVARQARLAEEKRYNSEAEDERKQSVDRMAEALLTGMAREIDATDKHFKKMIEKVANNKAAVAQLEKEHAAALNAIHKRFQADDLRQLDIYYNELTAIAAKEGKNVRELALQEIDSEYKAKNDIVTADIKSSKDRRKAFEYSMKALVASKAKKDIDELQQKIDTETAIIARGNEVQKLLQAKHQKDLKNINAGFDDKKSGEDNVKNEQSLQSDMDNNEKNGRHVLALQQQKKLLDLQLKIAVDAEKKKGNITTDIETEFAKKKAAIEQQLVSAKIHAGDKLINAVLANSKKDSAIYKAAFLAKKATTIADTIISTKQAVMDSLKAYSGIPFIGTALGIAQAAFMAVQGATSIAEIAKQKPGFAGGGQYISDGRGALLPGYSRTDNTNAHLRSGEAVVVSEAMRNPWARNLVSAINVAHGGRDFSMPNVSRGYAIGGIFTDGGNANRYYNQPVNDIKEMANTVAYQMINNFPPIYVDVKDVNNQQNILAQTVNRVNL